MWRFQTFTFAFRSQYVTSHAWHGVMHVQVLGHEQEGNVHCICAPNHTHFSRTVLWKWKALTSCSSRPSVTAATVTSSGRTTRQKLPRRHHGASSPSSRSPSSRSSSSSASSAASSLFSSAGPGAHKATCLRCDPDLRFIQITIAWLRVQIWAPVGIQVDSGELEPRPGPGLGSGLEIGVGNGLVSGTPSGADSLLPPALLLVRPRTILMRAARDQLVVRRLLGTSAASGAISAPTSMPSGGRDSSELHFKAVRQRSSVLW